MDIQGYEWENLENAPERVGIYAWYLTPNLRKADLYNSTSTKDNLIQLANQLRIPDFDVKAHGHLSLFLQGNLIHEHSSDGNKRNFPQLVESVLQDESNRKTFAKILSNSAPHLMSPLYIGVATNVRQRLLQHKKDIFHFRNMQKLKSDSISIEEEKQKFALEIVKRGIPNRQLKVFVTTMHYEDNSLQEIRDIAEAVETILNRLFYPIMGRR